MRPMRSPMADAYEYGPESLPFEVRQAFWGYAIRSTEGAPVLLQVAQGAVMAMSATFVASAMVLLLSPADGDHLSIPHLGAAILLMASALFLLRFATRGMVVELQVDLARGELREIVSHRVGPATMLGRHDFDPAASLHIHRRGAVLALPCLFLHHRGSAEGLCIAQGPEPVLLQLRARLAHDLRLGTQDLCPDHHRA